MTLNNFSSGVNTNFSTELNDNFAAGLRNIITLAAGGTPVDVITNDSDLADQSNTTAYARQVTDSKQFVCFLPYIDRCDDSSVDATIWADSGNGSVNENTGRLNCNVSGNNVTRSHVCSTSGSTGYDVKADMELCFTTRAFVQIFDWDTIGGTQNNSVAVQVNIVGSTSGRATLVSASRNSVGTTTTTRFVHVTIDESAQEATVYVDDSVGTTVDLSSLTGTEWYLELRCSGVFDGGDNNYSLASSIYGFAAFKTTDTPAELTYQTTAQTLTKNKASAFVTLSDFINENNPKLAISVDNGSTFTSDANVSESILTAATAGDDAVIRIKETPTTTFNYPERANPVIRVFGAIFD